MGFIETLESLDRELFLLINGAHSDAMDPVMAWISDKKSWIPFYALLLIPLWKLFKKKIYFPLVFIALLILATDQLSVHLFKNVFMRFRPCHNLEIMDMVHTVNGKCGGKYGFLSNHASNSFALAMFLAIQFRRKYAWLAWIMFFWAALASYSRIYLGVHYPADVIAGALLGGILGWLFHKGMQMSMEWSKK